MGSFLDAWHEHFSVERWDKALDACGLSSELFTGEWDTDVLLPWDHMDIRVNKRFLLRELKLAQAGKTTNSCMDLCSHCGLQGEQCGICVQWQKKAADKHATADPVPAYTSAALAEIGRASCRERV